MPLRCPCALPICVATKVLYSLVVAGTHWLRNKRSVLIQYTEQFLSPYLGKGNKFRDAGATTLHADFFGKASDTENIKNMQFLSSWWALDL